MHHRAMSETLSLFLGADVSDNSVGGLEFLLFRVITCVVYQ